jgi:hypothetical protein
MRLFKNVVAHFILPLCWEDFVGQASPINQATTEMPKFEQKLNSPF